jgi:hypothetical protein
VYPKGRGLLSCSPNPPIPKFYKNSNFAGPIILNISQDFPSVEISHRNWRIINTLEN